MAKSIFRVHLVSIILILAAAASVFVWDNYFRYNPEKVYAQAEKEYIAAMTADTYGGKTPQETLDLFVAALRAEDVELASKYFLLDENLGREKWVQLLERVNSEGNFSRLAEDISKKAEPGDIKSDTDFGFVLRNSDGTVGIQIDLRFNKYSAVWKIESI